MGKNRDPWELRSDLTVLRTMIKSLLTILYSLLNLNQKKKKKPENEKRKKTRMKQGWHHEASASSSSSSFFFFFVFSVRLPLSFNGSRGFSSELFFSSFLGTYRLSHCWIFILQPQTLRSYHHFFLFFFSLSLAQSLYHGFRRLLILHFSLCIFFDCSFCIFFLSLCILLLPLHFRVF